MSANPARPAYAPRWPLIPVRPRTLCWHRYEGGLVEMGHTGDRFHFDNEAPRHKVWLQPFEIASHPVTHGEFAAFIADGGYQNPALWLSLGWDWVRANHIDAPLYWEKVDGAWHTFTLHGMMPIDPATPMCHLSYFEADAFARWAGARLPTEAEWEHAAQTVAVAGNFMDADIATPALHPLPAITDADADTQPAQTPEQMFGDVWEWTQSSYAAYPGFRSAEGAVGEYNGKFMCNQYVLRGGSCATPRGHVRASYRNFFPPDARWQFSGVRLARDL